MSSLSLQSTMGALLASGAAFEAILHAAFGSGTTFAFPLGLQGAAHGKTTKRHGEDTPAPGLMGSGRKDLFFGGALQVKDWPRHTVDHYGGDRGGLTTVACDGFVAVGTSAFLKIATISSHTKIFHAKATSDVCAGPMVAEYAQAIFHRCQVP